MSILSNINTALWSLVISALVMLISVFALAHTIRVNKATRECNFGYVIHERLINLASEIDKVSASYEQEFAEVQEWHSDAGTTSSSDSEAADRVTSLIAARVKTVEPLLRNFELNRISFSDNEFADISNAVQDVQDKSRKFLEMSRQSNVAMDEEYRELFIAADTAATQMKDKAEDALGRTTEKLRKSCGWDLD